MYWVQNKADKKSKLKKRKNVLYFTTWDSACKYCILAGLNLKTIKVRGVA